MKQALGKINFPSYFSRAVHSFAIHNKGRTFRQKIFSLLNPTPTSGNLQHLIDYLIIVAVLLSVICIVLETVPWIHQIFYWEFHFIEISTVALFSIEYLGRVYSCCEEPRYQRPIVGRVLYMCSLLKSISIIASSQVNSIYRHHQYPLQGRLSRKKSVVCSSLHDGAFSRFDG
jgi:hypothetical protein